MEPAPFGFYEFRMDRRHYTDNRRGSVVHYIGLLRDGRARLVTDRETVSVTAGDLFYIPRGCIYQSFWEGDPLIRFDSYGFRQFPVSNLRRYRLQLLRRDAEIDALIDRLAADKRVTCGSVGLLYLLLDRLLPTMAPEQSDPDRALAEATRAFFRQSPDAGVEQAARACGVSASGLYAAFSRLGEGTPNELRQQILCEKAAELLMTTTLSVEEISRILHFSSSSYFRKILRHHTGSSPTDIRKSASL